MNTPTRTYIASSTAFAEGREGKFIRSARASSTISQDDAQQKADKLAREYANEAAIGKTRLVPEMRYPYGVRALVEPVLRNVAAPSGGGEAARITKNSYGASVLNAYHVMFVDVDTESKAGSGFDPRTGERHTGQTVTQDAAINALVELVAARPELAFRVYRTCAGLRYICTSRLFDPASGESEQVLKTLQSDWRYTLLCNKQKCYRARLTPKSWRCFAELPIEPDFTETRQTESRGFFARLFGSGVAKPRMRRLTEPEDFAVCHYVQTIGSEKVAHPEIAEIVRLHDEACGVNTRKPLA